MKGRNLNKQIEWKFLRFKVVEVRILKWHKLKMYTFLKKKSIFGSQNMHMIIDYHYCNYFTHNEEKERIWVSSSSPVSVNTFDSNSKHLPRSPNTIFSLGQGIPSFSNKKVWNTFSCPGVFMTLRHIACFIWYTWVHIAWKSITMQFSNHWLPIDTHHPIAKHYY